MSNLNDFLPKVQNTKVVGTDSSGINTNQTVDMTGYTDAVVYYDDAGGSDFTVNFTNVKSDLLAVVTKKTADVTNNNTIYLRTNGTGGNGHQIAYGQPEKTYLLINSSEYPTGKEL